MAARPPDARPSACHAAGFDKLKPYMDSEAKCMSYAGDDGRLLAIGYENALLRVFNFPTMDFRWQIRCVVGPLPPARRRLSMPHIACLARVAMGAAAVAGGGHGPRRRART
jgi:hypothetical protein